MSLTFKEWFQSQQGQPYYTSYTFAESAWNAAIEAEAGKPKSAAESAIGPCDCDPHVETCDQCAPYLAEDVCRVQDHKSYTQDNLSIMDDTQVGKGEPVSLPNLPAMPAGIAQVPGLGELYDRLQVQQYAVRYYDTAPQPCPRCQLTAAEMSEAHAEGFTDPGDVWSSYKGLRAKCAELGRDLTLVSAERDQFIRSAQNSHKSTEREWKRAEVAESEAYALKKEICDNQEYMKDQQTVITELQAKCADLEGFAFTENQKRQSAETSISDALARISWADAEIEGLQKQIALLRNELAQAKIYTPGRRAAPIPSPVAVGECNKPFWFNETDEEFAASGKPYAEVTE